MDELGRRFATCSLSGFHWLILHREVALATRQAVFVRAAIRHRRGEKISVRRGRRRSPFEGRRFPRIIVHFFAALNAPEKIDDKRNLSEPHDEVMSTRGRANIIRAALELRTSKHDPLKSDELDAALSNCLSCKGCTPECPSNVNLALLKVEMLHARWRRDGLPLRERILSNVDLLGKLGCLMVR